MSGSSFGTIFRVTTWGESHGKGIGAVIDGCPSGLPLKEDDIQGFLDRRRPGQNHYTTQRSEADRAEILSGVFEGKTTGTPISVMVRNHDQHSSDYADIASYYRPGHADLTYDLKYGFRDFRGGGRSSGRETVGRVAAGAVASKMLSELGIRITAWTSRIGGVSCDPARFDADHLQSSLLNMPDPEAEEKASSLLDKCIKDQTSLGGSVDCIVSRMIPGIGEPVFDKLDADLGKALFSIGAVKAVEIGSGCRCAEMYGHEHNDLYSVSPDEGVIKQTNHAGGIYGGISDGSDLRIRVFFKPTPSIGREQSALTAEGSCRSVSIRGRHDPVIVPRAVVVVESMTAIVLADQVLRNMGSTMSGLKRFYDAIP